MNHASIVRFFPVAIVVLVFSACVPDADHAQKAGESVGGAEDASAGRALVLYAEGDVTAKTAGGWTPLATGDFLERAQSVKTGPRSICELRFGDRAAIRIEEKTEIELETVATTPGGTNIGIRQPVGTLLCKVEKLTGNERFRVRTKSAVCGVKGTEFAVTANERTSILVVRKGTVALRPLALDNDALASKFKDEEAGGDEAIAAFAAAERVVGEGEAAEVSAASAEKAEKSLDAAERAVSEFGGEPADDAREKFKRAVAKAGEESRSLVGAPRRLTRNERALLEKIDELAERASEAGVSRSGGKGSARKKIVVTVNPESADIFLAGEPVGTGRYETEMPGDAMLELSIMKTGYQTVRLTIGPEENRDAYVVTLEPIRAETATGVPLHAAGAVKTRDGTDRVIEAVMGRQEILIANGSMGMENFPNGPVVLLGKDPFRLLASMWGQTYLLEGEDIRRFTKISPVLPKGGAGTIDNGAAYIGGLYRGKGKLYAFYQADDVEGFENEPRIESEQYAMWYGRIAAAVSDDGGATWTKLGAVLESPRGKSWSAYPGQGSRGMGDAAVLPDKNGRSLYLYSCEYSHEGFSQVTIVAARADLRAGAPVPGSWKKYYRGAFSEKGLGGRATPVLDATQMDFGDCLHPCAFYSKSLDRYVMIFGIYFWKEFENGIKPNNTGIYVSYSADGVVWSRPYRLIPAVIYPVEGRESAGRVRFIPDRDGAADGWLVYPYSERYGERAKNLVPCYLAGRRISLKFK